MQLWMQVKSALHASAQVAACMHTGSAWQAVHCVAHIEERQSVHWVDAPAHAPPLQESPEQHSAVVEHECPAAPHALHTPSVQMFEQQSEALKHELLSPLHVPHTPLLQSSPRQQVWPAPQA